jgi:hypothetical protein
VYQKPVITEHVIIRLVRSIGDINSGDNMVVKNMLCETLCVNLKHGCLQGGHILLSILQESFAEQCS